MIIAALVKIEICFRSASSRVVVASWWMFVVLIVSCYTANLAAFLTVTSIANTITSAEELVAQSRIEYGTIRGGGSYETLKVLTHFCYADSVQQF